MMTLFTKKPEGITNEEILKRFGYPDPEFSKHKILHQTIANEKKRKPHDHGSAFRLTRLSEKTFPLLFKTHKRIL